MVCDFHLTNLVNVFWLISDVNTFVLQFFFKYLNKEYLHIYLFSSVLSEKFPSVDHFLDKNIYQQQIICKEIKKSILLCIVVYYFPA